jgi:hypothetical protein
MPYTTPTRQQQTLPTALKALLHLVYDAYHIFPSLSSLTFSLEPDDFSSTTPAVAFRTRGMQGQNFWMKSRIAQRATTGLPSPVKVKNLHSSLESLANQHLASFQLEDLSLALGLLTNTSISPWVPLVAERAYNRGLEHISFQDFVSAIKSHGRHFSPFKPDVMALL